MTGFLDIRFAFKFGVQTMLEGKVVNLYQGQHAIDLMKLPYWPQGTTWPEHIPNDGDAKGVRWVYLADLKKEYPTLRFVLMAWSIRRSWFVVLDNKSDGKWLDIVGRTIGWWDKEKVMKKMVRIKY